MTFKTGRRFLGRFSALPRRITETRDRRSRAGPTRSADAIRGQPTGRGSCTPEYNFQYPRARFSRTRSDCFLSRLQNPALARQTWRCHSASPGAARRRTRTVGIAQVDDVFLDGFHAETSPEILHRRLRVQVRTTRTGRAQRYEGNAGLHQNSIWRRCCFHRAVASQELIAQAFGGALVSGPANSM